MTTAFDDPTWTMNLNSTQQLQEFLFEFLQLKPITEKNKKTGNISVNEATITHYAENENVLFCNLLLAYRKLIKAKNTYLSDILRNISDLDFMLHPEFWLNTAETYRSSSTDPNFQNMPKHGDIMEGLAWKIIRRMFVSLKRAGIDPNFLLAETDYDGAEVKVAGMLGNDPTMIADLNEEMDMHSHWAIELFGLKGMSYEDVKNQYDETYRFLAKNNFTFANFFGAAYTSIAQEMRKSPHYHDYVQSKFNQMQIKGTSWDNYYIDYSEKHIEQCQLAFYERYYVYKAWQDSLVSSYYSTGYVDNPFGFRRRYPLKRNEIINHPIQSTSFLLLLDALIRAEEVMEKDGYWQSHLIGQIHDSAFANIHKHEAGDFIDLMDDMMVNKPHLPWTHKVRMKTDWSIGHSWVDLKKVNAYKKII